MYLSFFPQGHDCCRKLLHPLLPSHHRGPPLRSRSLPPSIAFSVSIFLSSLRRDDIFAFRYVEGWALYCEALGEEMDAYKGPEELFGRLSMVLMPICHIFHRPRTFHHCAAGHDARCAIGDRHRCKCLQLACLPSSSRARCHGHPWQSRHYPSFQACMLSAGAWNKACSI